MEFIDLKTQQVRIGAELQRQISNVLEHGQYIMGPEVAVLEKRLAEFCEVKECITVSSGTEALLISLMALEVGPGDEVITSPFTFVATAEVIALVGATPVFVDIDPNTYNLDPKHLELAISSRTKAIIPVSMYGQPTALDEINQIANAHNIAVIEDAAQSFGATFNGKRSCNLSSIGCTSFFPSKPLGCYGDGGAIFTNDESIAKVMREIRVHGQERRYYHTRVGVGGRMDTLQCAIVLAKLTVFDDELEKRQIVARRYHELLAEVEGVIVKKLIPAATSAWAQFTVEVEDREKVIEVMKSRSVPTAVHYPMPLHLQPAYRDTCLISGSVKCSEVVAKKVLSLPMHPYLTEQQQKTVVEALSSAVRL